MIITGDIVLYNLIESCNTYEDYEKLAKTERDAITSLVCRCGKVLDNDGFITRVEFHGRVYSVHFINGIRDIELI